MNVLWDKEKAKKLLRERNISFDEIADLLMKGQFSEILEHPRRPDQMISIIPYRVTLF